jgi:hypothetical protein
VLSPPPIIRTLPSSNRVAECPLREVCIFPVETNPEFTTVTIAVALLELSVMELAMT